MAILDTEIEQDLIDDKKAIAYIQAALPAELKEKYPEPTLQHIIDALVSELADDDTLDAEADTDGFVELDLEEISHNVGATLRAEGCGTFPEEELLLITEFWFDAADEDED